MRLVPGFPVCEDTVVPKRRTIAVALSVLISAALIVFLLTKINVKDIVQTFRQIYLPALLVYGAFSLSALSLRAWRTRRLLSPLFISWKNVFLVTFIRNGFEDLLPARLGSLSYIYLLNKSLGFPIETAASTFVVAFVLDFLTLSPFLMASILLAGWGGTNIPGPLLFAIALAYFLLVSAILWKIVPVSKIFLNIYERILRFLKAADAAWARRSLEKFRLTIDSLSGIQGRKDIIPLFSLSFFIRLAKYLSLYALLVAVLHSYGFGFEDLSFWKTILGITAAEMTSALPVKGLADFGTWESAWALAFSLMGLDLKYAVLSGIAVHVTTNLFEYGLSLVSILVLAVSRRRNRIRRVERVDATPDF